MNQNDIRIMFEEIASNYDKINDIISLGLHKKIKRISLKLLNLPKNSKGLDLCTGTGDFVEIIEELYPLCLVTGIDSCDKMLEKAKIKNPGKSFIKADCTKLPFENSSFDFITIGFGLRNIIERDTAIKEIIRVLNRGGLFLHLDFGKHNITGRFFDFYTPLVASIFGGNKDNYKYLIDSKNKFPEPDELIKLFEKYGFKLLKRKDFLFGAISVLIMQKFN